MPEQAMQLPAYLLLSDDSFTGLRCGRPIPQTWSKQCAFTFTAENEIGIGSLCPRFSTLVYLGETILLNHGPGAKCEAHPGDKFDSHTNTL